MPKGSRFNMFAKIIEEICTQLGVEPEGFFHEFEKTVTDRNGFFELFV